jgi:hypothetical protein
MYINRNEISLVESGAIELKQCVISNMSKMIPLWAIYNPINIEDNFFMSNLIFFDTNKENVKLTAAKNIHPLMGLDSKSTNYTLNDKYIIHRHSLIYLNYNTQCTHKHIICLCKIDDEFILLARKDIKEKYILNLVKIYSKEYSVLKVNSIENYIYAKIPLDNLMNKAIDELKEDAFNFITENILKSINE